MFGHGHTIVLEVDMRIIKEKRRRLPFELLPMILTLAWPTMLEEAMHTLVQYVDTAMVGALGTEATAAVGSTTTISWLIGGTVSAIGVGFLAYISKMRGAGREDEVRRASAQSVLAVLLFGAIFTAITLSLSSAVPIWMRVDPDIRDIASEYFFIMYTPMLARTAIIIFGAIHRSVGDTKTPMIIGVCINLINIVLDFFLIYPSRTVNLFFGELFIPGAGLGVVGAAAASAIAFTVGGIMITVSLFRHKILSPKGFSFSPNLGILSVCFKVAFPNMLHRFGTSLGYVAFASMINSLGDVSAAAHTIANTVESAFYIPGYGMQAAASTLAGNALGAGKRERLRDLTRMMLAFEVALMVISGGLLFAFAPSMVRLFSSDAQVILLGSTVLRMVALSEPFYGVSIIIEGIMMGMGKTVMPFVCGITGMWGIRILGTLICIEVFSLGLVAAWACMIAHNMILFGLYITYYLRGKLNIPKKEAVA